VSLSVSHGLNAVVNLSVSVGNAVVNLSVSVWNAVAKILVSGAVANLSVSHGGNGVANLSVSDFCATCWSPHVQHAATSHSLDVHDWNDAPLCHLLARMQGQDSRRVRTNADLLLQSHLRYTLSCDLEHWRGPPELWATEIYDATPGALHDQVTSQHAP